MLNMQTFRNTLIGLLICALIFGGSLASIALWQHWPIQQNAPTKVASLTTLQSSVSVHKESYTSAAYPAQFHPALQTLQPPGIMPLDQVVQLKPSPTVQIQHHFTFFFSGPTTADASHGVTINVCARTNNNSPAYGEDVYLTADPGASFLTNIVTLDTHGCASALLFSLQTGDVVFNASIYYITPLFNTNTGNTALGTYTLPAVGRTHLTITKASPPTPPGSVFGMGHGSSPFAGKSINLALGNYIYQHTDITLPIHNNSISITRTYNSLDSTNGPLGIGWTFPYNQSLSFPTSTTISVAYGDGHHEDYVLKNGAYTPLNEPGTLSQLSHVGKTYVMRHKDQSQDIYNASSGKLISMIDRNGNTTDLVYTNAYLTQVSDASSGRGVRFQYNANGHITTIRNLLDNSIAATYTYDANNDLITVNDQLGNSTTYTYDDAYHLLSIENALGNIIISNTYDASNRVTRQVNATGSVTSMTYNSGSTTVTDPLMGSTTYAFDFFYRQISVTNALKVVTDYAYDKNGELRAVTDGNGHTVQYTYDPEGNLLNIVDAMGIKNANPTGHTTTFSYDHQNNLVEVIDANGYTTYYSHDANGNVIEVKNALGDVTHLSYNSFGELLNNINPIGGKYYTYNTYGDMTTTSDNSGDTATTSYSNANGLPNKVSNANGNSLLTIYDADNHVTSVTDPLQHQVNYTYDSIGRKVSATNADGDTTNYVYDTNNRLIEVKNPDDTSVQYNYDANGNLLEQSDEEQHVTTYTYDANNQVKTVTDALGNTTSYTYDGVGNIVSRTDAKGQITLYTYDANNRLTEVKADDSTLITYTYDGAGNRLSMTDATGKSSYSYDALNRLIAVTDGNGHTQHMGYDANSNLISLVYPDGRTIHYSYNTNNKLASVTDWANHTSTYTYDAAGNLVKLQLPNHIVTTYSYNAANQLTEVKNTGPKGIISDFHYTLDAYGNRTGITTSGGAVEAGKTLYTYDTMQRLISAHYPDGSQVTYTYDADGNRSSMTSVMGTTTTSTAYTYNATDELTQIQTGKTQTTLSYDANGNQTIVQTGKKRSVYQYNTQGQLISVMNGKTTVHYGYNGDGLRVSQFVTTGTTTRMTRYVLSISRIPQVLEEIAGKETTDELYGLALLAATPLNTTASSIYYSYDGLGSVSNITDRSGKVLSSMSYDAFGALHKSTGQQTEFQLNGQQVDATDGLTYLRGRYYDSTLGRFIMRDTDPGSPNVSQTLNHYIYANDDPTNVVDPTGTLGIDTFVAFVVGAFIGAIVSVVTQAVSHQSINWAEVGFDAVVGGVVGAVVETDPALITEMLPDKVTEALPEEAVPLIDQVGIGAVKGAVKSAGDNCIETCGTSNFSWGTLAMKTVGGTLIGAINAIPTNSINGAIKAFLQRTGGSEENSAALPEETPQEMPGESGLSEEMLPQRLQQLNSANT